MFHLSNSLRALENGKQAFEIVRTQNAFSRSHGDESCCDEQLSVIVLNESGNE